MGLNGGEKLKKVSYLLGILLFILIVFISFGSISASDNITQHNELSDNSLESTNSNVLNSNSNLNKTVKTSSITVNGTSDEDIQHAVNSAHDGDVIYLENKTYTINNCINFNNKNITICGGFDLNDNLTSTLTGGTNRNQLFNVSGNSELRFNNVNFIKSDHPFNNRGSIIIFNNCLFDDNGNYNITQYSIYVYNGLIVFNNTKIYNTKVNADFIHTQYGSVIYLINSTVSNTTGTGDFISLHSTRLFVIDSKFENNSNKGSVLESSVFSSVNVENSTFNNTGGYCIYTNLGSLMINNSTFTNSNNTAIYCYRRFNGNITNSVFTNNHGINGGAICYDGTILNVDNCTFINNSALYGGALNIRKKYDIPYNNFTLNNSRFINNTAIISGGALSVSNYSTIINNTLFENNSAGYYGGAIVGSINTTNVTNTVFSDNYANETGYDIYYYGGELNLDNNTIDYDYVDNITDNNHIVIVTNHTHDYVFIFDNNHTGFCLEEYEYSPSVGVKYVHYNDTHIVINSVTHKPVADYVKILIYNYYGKVSDLFMNLLIWTFTCNDFENQDVLNSIAYKYLTKYNSTSNNFTDEDISEFNRIINETITQYSNGVRIQDHGAVTNNENNTVSVYDFVTEFSNGYQNFISFKIDTYPNEMFDFSVIKISNNPVVYKGKDTSFDIIVKNNGSLTLNNITVIEDSYDDLTYKSWSSVVGNWSFSYIDGKPTWKLLDPLGVNQSVRLHIIFSTNNSSLGGKINTVIVNTNQTKPKNTTNTTEVIENHTNNDSGNSTKNITTEKQSYDKKIGVKTTENTGVPIIGFVLSLFAIISLGFRNDKK